MTEYKVRVQSKFKKNFKKIVRGGRYHPADFKIVLDQLVNHQPLPAHYNDHALVNRFPERELHIKPDWLLVYRYHGQYLELIDTGSHSDLFR
ncbi:type II toxin-antitoxin system YafQ family toxin [Fructobacillus tropaeoli]|uniref:type II toxin-antitoxin system YafQ family toxin n=1 Tax=Fructobacillus tropaeoli TaxID=709323 RepID=UPI00194478A3|nr:type II toxin-antitoxin system YafQ family toxin [Fructobacillus tropaeoli]GIC69799.1 type II toxin-antitoxin system YafQ family toxin [Fructobacillus tropaeoli]